MDHITKVDFTRFKAFQRYTLHIREFNILVGPNNAGKSTILAAFRILAAGIRKANARNPEMVGGPRGKTWGYHIDLKSISVAEENIFHNYDDSEPASVKFSLSNGNTLLLFFPERGACSMIPDSPRRTIQSTVKFKAEFQCRIGFVPILGPVDHNEELYKEETARNSLYNYTAARNFRNIWHHFPEEFEAFRELLQKSWPGMDIEKPRIEYQEGVANLFMFCPEGRIPREIFWAGFGFQVWCQMLTHIVHARDTSVFLIDEPDIYLHAELQRQLIGILRELGPDIIIATHSTEIICDAEPDEIVLIDKKRSGGKRLKNPSELGEIFLALGAATNPTLTQLAKTRRVVFVEGKDFSLLSKIGQRLGYLNVANRSKFAVIPTGGFNPERIRNLLSGIETTLGCKVISAAILDRDYRTPEECQDIASSLETICNYVHIHHCKEIENFLLEPNAIKKAIDARVREKKDRGGNAQDSKMDITAEIASITTQHKNNILSQLLMNGRDFHRRRNPSISEATINQNIIKWFDELWADPAKRLQLIPGKEALALLNQRIQSECGISITPTGIAAKLPTATTNADLIQLMKTLESVSNEPVPNE